MVGALEGRTEAWLGRLRWVAVGVSLVWAVLVVAYGVGYLTTRAPGGLSLLLTVLAILLAIAVPIGLVWAVLWLWGSHLAHRVSEEALRIRILELEERVASLSAAAQDDVDDLPEVIVTPPPPRDPPNPPETIAEPAVASVAEPIPDPEDAPQAATPRPPEPIEDPIPERPPAEVDPGSTDGQPMLPFVDDGDLPLSAEDTIRALNFPQDAQDKVGFAILERALARHDLARLLQASEDCLNFLAHVGLYMDDLMPAPASADDWRTFAKGGAARAALLPLTGITDSDALATVRKEMRADPIFRDASLHFQRRFDQMLHDFAPTASDAELLDLIDTRTGRAFILLAQVSGSLDAQS